MTKQDFLRGWHIFFKAFRLSNYIKESDADKYFDVLDMLKITPDTWLAIAEQYARTASTYDVPPDELDVGEECERLEYRKMLAEDPRVCPLCQGQGSLPVHALHLETERAGGRRETKTYYLPICRNGTYNPGFLTDAMREAVVKWSLDPWASLPCDCMHAYGKCETYSDIIRTRAPLPDDWRFLGASYRALHALIERLWPNREEYVTTEPMKRIMALAQRLRQEAENGAGGGKARVDGGND